MFTYEVRKMWYDDYEIVESETPLTNNEIRKRIDEKRLSCDEIYIEEVNQEED